MSQITASLPNAVRTTGSWTSEGSFDPAAPDGGALLTYEYDGAASSLLFEFPAVPHRGTLSSVRLILSEYPEGHRAKNVVVSDAAGDVIVSAATLTTSASWALGDDIRLADGCSISLDFNVSGNTIFLYAAHLMFTWETPAGSPPLRQRQRADGHR